MSATGNDSIWIGAQSAGFLTGASRQACYRLADSGEVTIRHTENNRLEFCAQDLAQRLGLNLTVEAGELLALADTGGAAAMREFGLFLLAEGRETTAFTWLLQAAEKKDVDAMDWISICFLEGLGTTPDLAQALRWLGEAATAGHAVAQAKIEALQTSS
ncbi:tetratricopeptide repeat protein [Acidithiobacillus sp. IBUN Pt1247-S3]|uniref:tetratricopeptide repeat protein n=1 Tax=Acidithiobacillus sp. IBUN Pt1247-S3 TaxID=3166642 RepID=UPI0034E50004